LQHGIHVTTGGGFTLRFSGEAVTIGARDPLRHQEDVVMAVSVNLDSLLDKAYENLPLTDILDAPVAALSGVSDGDAEKLKAAFNIKTVRDLGTNKYFRAAVTLLDLEKNSG
jgi:hypothetical protein